MTFTQKIIGLIGVAVVLVGVLYVMGKIPHVQNMPVETPQTTIHTSVPVAPLISEKQTDKGIHKSYTLDLSYPKSSTSVFPEVYSYVEKTKADFLHDYSILSETDAAKFPAEASSYTLAMKTRIATSTNTVTYILETYQYEGGAHGGTAIATFTYTANGTYVSLDDLFTKPYLDTISQLSRTHFYANPDFGAQKNIIDEGTTPDPENYSVWYLTPNTLTFIFGEYQVAPYSAGIQEFAIPKTSLEDLVSTYR